MLYGIPTLIIIILLAIASVLIGFYASGYKYLALLVPSIILYVIAFLLLVFYGPFSRLFPEKYRGV